MAINEGLKPITNDQAPVDPNVRVPDYVKRAAEQAEAAHKAAYQPEAMPQDINPPASQAQEQTPPAPQAQEQTPPAPQAQEQTPPAPQAQEQFQPMKPGDENVTAEEWRHRFLSMQGRFSAASRTIGSMEQQMQELGQELVRTQNMVSTMQTQQPAPQPSPQPNHGNLITDEDRANYGDELIDLARRAALSSVSPQLAHLEEENKRLTNQVKTTSKRELFMSMDRAVPNWREINKSVQFKSWLRLPNIYTGQLKGQMLQAAVDGAEAPKVIQLFKDFLTEAHATGQMVPAQQIEQQPPSAVPRTPAVNLETLAAPGRARPASGDTQVPVDKPTYTRAQITKFYEDSRKGMYAGRQAEYDAIQNDLTAAQREGRIR